MAYTAAAMYGAAAVDGALEGLLPGDPKFSLVPVVIVAVVLAGLLAVGPRLPRAALAPLGPIGAALTAFAVATTPGAGDGAVLYAMPVLWTTLFFGWRGAVVIVICVAAGQAVALLILPAAVSYPDRWLDVMVAVCAMAIVVLALERRNEELLDRLGDEARTDALTGVLNRRGFDERATVELARTRREHSCLAVVAFDIDYFKRVNDEWGHDVGDRVLSWIGTLLAIESRDIDLAARLGGEEFAVLLPGTNREGAEAFSERVRAALVAITQDGLPAVRMSAGIVVDDEPDDIHAMLRNADSALYEAKRRGRDRAITYGAFGSRALADRDLADRVHG